jgi:dihydrodipicolinate synthase/N-acetylneuraminate lyase
MPGPYVEIYNAFQRGDLVEASRISQGVCRVVTVQGLFDFTAATYAFLNLLGYQYGATLQPMPNLQPAQVDRLKSELLKVIKPDPLEERRLIESRDFLA